MPDPKDLKDPKDQDPKNPPAKDPKDPDPKDPDPKDDDDFVKVPKSKWDQNYARMKKAEDDAEALRKEKEEREEADKRASGEFEELANKHKAEASEYKTKLSSAEERLAKNEEVFTQLLKERTAEFSDEQKAAIDGLEGFSTQQKLNFIANNKVLFGAKSAGGGGQSPQPRSNAEKPDDKIKGLEAERDELTKKAKQGGLTSSESRRAREIGRELSVLREEKI